MDVFSSKLRVILSSMTVKDRVSPLSQLNCCRSSFGSTTLPTSSILRACSKFIIRLSSPFPFNKGQFHKNQLGFVLGLVRDAFYEFWPGQGQEKARRATVKIPPSSPPRCMYKHIDISALRPQKINTSSQLLKGEGSLLKRWG